MPNPALELALALALVHPAQSQIAQEPPATRDLGVLAPAPSFEALLQDAATRQAYRPPSGPNFRINGQNESTLRFTGYVQTRYIFNARDTDVPDNDITQGFGFGELRLAATGNLMGDRLTYNAQMALESGVGRLTDAWVRYQIDEQWAIQMGSFKPAFLWEENSSATRQPLVERSLVDSYFRQSRAKQIEAQYRTDHFEARLGFSDGWRRNLDSRLGTTWGLTGRVSWLPLGTWSQHSDFQAWRGEEPMVALGLAAHVQDGMPLGISASEMRNRFLNDTMIVSWTADAHAEFDGWTLYGAVVGEHDRVPGTVGGGTRDAYGALFQAGYFITDQTQLNGRFEWGTTDGDLGRPMGIESAEDEFVAITAGVAHYFYGNNAKIVADVLVPLDEVGDVWSSTSRGTATDDAGADGQAVFRLQFQFAF